MIYKTAVLLILTLIPLMSFAAHEFIVEDQNGNPVEDAVIIAKGAAPKVSETPAVMDQINKAFSPKVLTIPVGQAVDFPNSDDIRHHVYSFSKAKPFEIRLYKGKPGSPIVFENPGIVVLGCNIHDSMIGYIVVTDSENWAQTNKDGFAQLNTEAVQEVSVWHPWLNVKADKVEIVPLLPSKSTHRIKLTLIPPEVKEPSFSTKRFKRYAR